MGYDDEARKVYSLQALRALHCMASIYFMGRKCSFKKMRNTSYHIIVGND